MNALRILSHIANHPLNENGKIKAIARFVRWQLVSRLIKQPVSLPFVNDTRLLVQSGMTGATGNWYSGLHEPEEMIFVLHALRRDDLFADIGANIGSYTILAAGGVGAKVISVEPLPSTYDWLLTNVRLNDLGERVDVRCCGISDRSGQLEFTSSLDTMNRVALPGEAGPTTAVPVVTLDELCAARTPNVIKIDVEGHEDAVLAGGEKTLSSNEVRAVLMETNGSGRRYGSDDDQIIDRMKAFGFKACRYDWKSRRLHPADRGSLNTIFVRDPDAVSERCRQAPQFTLVNGLI